MDGCLGQSHAHQIHRALEVARVIGGLVDAELVETVDYERLDVVKVDLATAVKNMSVDVPTNAEDAGINGDHLVVERSPRDHGRIPSPRTVTTKANRSSR